MIDVALGLGFAFLSGIMFTGTLHSVEGLSDMDTPSDAAFNAGGFVAFGAMAIGVVVL